MYWSRLFNIFLSSNFEQIWTFASSRKLAQQVKLTIASTWKNVQASKNVSESLLQLIKYDSFRKYVSLEFLHSLTYLYGTGAWRFATNIIFAVSWFLKKVQPRMGLRTKF